jgi:hypothetical protein
MQILQMLGADQDGDITVEELREELAFYWDKRIYKGTKTPVVERKTVPMTVILQEDK